MYDLIKKDLGFAIENLPLASAIPSTKIGRASKGGSNTVRKSIFDLGRQNLRSKCVEGRV
jgi:hypothetical protein